MLLLKYYKIRKDLILLDQQTRLQIKETLFFLDQNLSYLYFQRMTKRLNEILSMQLDLKKHPLHQILMIMSKTMKT